jgi:two-component system chemotaxis response regulator CheY
MERKFAAAPIGLASCSQITIPRRVKMEPDLPGAALVENAPGATLFEVCGI